MDEDILQCFFYFDESVLRELYTLVRDGLSSQLHTRLHQIANSTQYLTALTWHNGEKVSLLMVAALNGHDDVIGVLLTHYNSAHQIELKGRIKVHELEECIDGVTALYCACFRGHFNVAKTLIEIGRANVNQVTKDYPRYPLLIYAARLNHLDIVKFLIENKYADVNETKSTDVDRWPALIWAVWRDHTSIVRYLIENGADVNYSCNNAYLDYYTPVSWAVARGHIDSLRLLYEAGADITVRGVIGDTILMVAIRHKYYSIISFLVEQSINTVDDLELTACSITDFSVPIEKLHEILDLLKIAIQHRESIQLSKQCIEPKDIYDYKQECQTVDDLHSIRDDRNRILIEILLVLERIFHSRKDITILKPLHYYGDMLVDHNEFEKCLDLWIHMFYIYQELDMETILHRFVWVFCRMLTANGRIPVNRFLQICHLISEPSQTKERNLTIANAMYLVIITVKVLEQEEITKEERTSIYNWIQDLCRRQLTSEQGQTLLHLCVDIETNEVLSFRTVDTSQFLKFPNEGALRLLLTFGSRWLDVDATESFDGNTPLHIICQGSENENIIKLLLNYGCHVDCVNKNGRILLECGLRRKTKSLLVPQSTPNRLKCLCASLIVKQGLNTDALGPSRSVLNKFIMLHGVRFRRVRGLSDSDSDSN